MVPEALGGKDLPQPVSTPLKYHRPWACPGSPQQRRPPSQPASCTHLFLSTDRRSVATCFLSPGSERLPQGPGHTYLCTEGRAWA